MPRLPAAMVLSLLFVAGLPAGLLHADEEPAKIEDVYIEMDDGVRLASDVYLPPGTPTDGSVQVPCLVELTPYRKENRAAEAVSLLPYEGFGVIEVDARGTGGSEGEYDIVFSYREQLDTAQVIDWAAGSGWCSEKVGMFGGSYSGIIQYLVASLPEEDAPEHLAAIAPQRAYGDLYRDIVRHGGQLIGSFGAIWSTGTSAYYYQPPTNVDSEEGLSAWTDHISMNDPMIVPYLASPYIDARWETGGIEQDLYRDSSIHPHRIANLRVPALHLAGWFDAFTRGQVLTFQDALELERTIGDRGPNYLIVGPWDHSGTHFIDPENFSERLVEWYRHWLDDGPEPEWFGQDRVLYYQMGQGALDDDTGEWRTARSWPPEGDPVRYHLRADGALTTEPPADDEGEVSYVFDPTTGPAEFPSRWDNAAGVVPTSQRDQTSDGDRPTSPTFETEPLGSEVELAGPISLRLHLSTEGLGGDPEAAETAPEVTHQFVPPYHDTDIVVKLSDVAPDGTATLITEGFLRASHRTLDLENSQIVDGEVIRPVHHHLLEELDPPTGGEVREYWVEVWPTAKTFQEGHRIRLDVYSADTPNHLNLARPASNTIHLDLDEPSYLLLPISEPEADVAVASPPVANERAGELPATGGTAPAALGVLALAAGRMVARRGWR